MMSWDMLIMLFIGYGWGLATGVAWILTLWLDEAREDV